MNSNLEIKGGILEMIASIDDPQSLQDLRQLILEFMGNQVRESDYWEELSDLEKGELEEALLESEDTANHVDHVTVMERHTTRQTGLHE